MLLTSTRHPHAHRAWVSAALSGLLGRTSNLRPLELLQCFDNKVTCSGMHWNSIMSKDALFAFAHNRAAYASAKSISMQRLLVRRRGAA